MAESWSVSVHGFNPIREARNLRVSASQIPRAAALGAKRMSEHAAARSVANAPILTGRLRAGISSSPVEISGGGEDRVYTSRVKMDPIVWYAPLMYVFLAPHAIYPLYNLGPISRQQPLTEEGGVGGTWTDRVVNHHEQQYFDGILQLFDQIVLEGGRAFSDLRFSP